MQWNGMVARAETGERQQGRIVITGLGSTLPLLPSHRSLHRQPRPHHHHHPPRRHHHSWGQHAPAQSSFSPSSILSSGSACNFSDSFVSSISTSSINQYFHRLVQAALQITPDPRSDQGVFGSRWIRKTFFGSLIFVFFWNFNNPCSDPARRVLVGGWKAAVVWKRGGHGVPSYYPLEATSYQTALTCMHKLYAILPFLETLNKACPFFVLWIKIVNFSFYFTFIFNTVVAQISFLSVCLFTRMMMMCEHMSSSGGKCNFQGNLPSPSFSFHWFAYVYMYVQCAHTHTQYFTSSSILLLCAQ